LIKAALPIDRNAGRALLCLEDVAYNESYYGYSASRTADGELAARYLHLLVHSSLWLYYVLLTSGEIGVERPKFQKADLDRFPIVPVDNLSQEQKIRIRQLSDRIIGEDPGVFGEIDNFYAGLYGLDRRDIEVINDTLAIRDPGDELGRRASMIPAKGERTVFRNRLESILRPFFRITGDEPQVSLWKPAHSFLKEAAPFSLLFISKRGTPVPDYDGLFHDVLLKLAEDTGSTRIIQEVDGGLLVALINQYR
jgi:hypothetical protein